MPGPIFLKQLFYMLAHNLCEVEHGNLALASEQHFQLCISVDVALVGLVLETVLLNVIPNLFDDLSAGKRLATDDVSKCSTWIERGHECGIRRPLLFRSGFLCSFLGCSFLRS